MTFNTKQLINHSLQKLNEWNNDYQKFIHDLYENKFDIYHQYFVKRIDLLRKDITQLRSTISERFFEHDTTNEDIILCTLNIRCILNK
jgi:hypothetical protein